MSEQSAAEVAAHLLACEKSLLDPALRRDRARVAHFLAPGFIEFGSSGRIWTREEILTHLESEDFTPPALEDFACRPLAEGVALVAYQALRTDPQTGLQHATLRSSIWIRIVDSGDWKMCFHQGTRIER